MREKLIKFLENFGMLTPEEVIIIADNTRLKIFPKGHILLREGDIYNGCYAVVEGLIREYYIKDGIEKTTAFYTEGQPVTSFTSSTKNIPAKHFLQCEEDCILSVGSDSIIEEISRHIPRLSSIIQQEIEKGAGELQDKLANFMTSTPEERYTHLLETQPSLLLRVPQHQIASYLGITPESLSRIKKRIHTNLYKVG